jgi:16S rRNA (adenine1518-N6/adenine1519-N6)-dimethyltransferase
LIHLEARKSLGQHFLVDPKIHVRIVAAVAPQPGDVVVEIGPGTGLLTRQLLASPIERLIAFELDTRAVPILREEFASEGSRFTVIEQDFLTVDLHTLAQDARKLRVVGNIPYYITSPILFKLIDERSELCDATLLVQLEVAERLRASPRTKAYGIPTVLANFFGEVKFLFKISAGSFRPAPRVDSALVKIDFERDYFARNGKPVPAGFDEAQFRRLVRGLFAMRRKTVRNNLKTLVSSEVIAQLESTAPAMLTARAEEFAIEDFLELSLRIAAASGS